MSPRNLRSYIQNLCQYDFLNKSYKKCINRHAKMDGEKSTRLHPTQRTTDNWRMLRIGEIIFAEGEHSANVKWSGLKHADEWHYTDWAGYIWKYIIHMYISAIIINKKRGKGCKRKMNGGKSSTNILYTYMKLLRKQIVNKYQILFQIILDVSYFSYKKIFIYLL